MPAVKTDRAWLNTVEITSRPLRDRITDVVLEAWEASRRHQAEQPEEVVL